MTGKDSNHWYRIGLTGGIASGKSTVADMFVELGIPVIDTDIIAREVVRPGAAALHEIEAKFGTQVIDTNGSLDRILLRKLIFEDASARRALESILHPRIGAEARRQAAAANGPYQLIVVPLLTGSPLLQFVDRVLVVDCREATQIQRLMARDTETIEQAQKILAAQASRADRLAIANDVIDSEQSLGDIQSCVRNLDEMYRRLVRPPDPLARSPENP